MKLKIYCYNCYFDNFISSLSKNEKKEELISCCQRWFFFCFFVFFFFTCYMEVENTDVYFVFYE